jgi:hypothetical protein
VGESRTFEFPTKDEQRRAAKALVRSGAYRVCNAQAGKAISAMLEIQEPDASGEMKPMWQGMMPLKWRSVGYLPLGKTIGYPAECDLCHAIKDGWIEISPAIPEPAMKVQRTEQCSFMLVLQARSVEEDSDVIRVQISWNGRWSSDADEMARNLVIRTV